MLRVLLAIAAGVAVWKYRDSLRGFVKSNEGPARERADGLLRTVREKSDTLLDRAKERVSAGFEGTRQRLRRPESRAARGGPTE